MDRDAIMPTGEERMLRGDGVSTLIPDSLKGWIDGSSRSPVLSGCVYLIEAKGQGAFKIGLTSQNPRDRLSGLSTGMPFEPVLLGVIQTANMFALEKLLHNHYADKGLWIRGEWFSLGSEDVSYFFDVKEEVERGKRN